LVEYKKERRAVAPITFRDQPVFWTIDGALIKSSEDLIRELPLNTSLSVLVSALNTESLQVPEPLLCSADADSLPTAFAYNGKEVISIEVHREQRRVDLKWGTVSSTPRWRSFPRNLWRGSHTLHSERAYREFRTFRIGQQEVPTTGVLEGEIAIRAFGYTYLLPTSGVARKLVETLDQLESHPESPRIVEMALFLFEVISLLLRGTISAPVDIKTLQELAAEQRYSLEEEISRGDLISALNESGWRIFDPTRWARTGSKDEY